MYNYLDLNNKYRNKNYVDTECRLTYITVIAIMIIA